MSDQNQILNSSNLSLTNLWRTKGRWSEIILGSDANGTLDTSVAIKKVNQDGGLSTLRTFTSLPDTRSIKLETQPGSTIDVVAVGASTDLYVEMNDLAEV